MDGTNQQIAYHNAIKDAKAHLARLNSEIESLTKRQLALLSASQALEGVTQGPERSARQENTLADIAINHPVAHSENQDRVSIEHISQLYVHRVDSVNEIQRRIDIAIGR